MYHCHLRIYFIGCRQELFAPLRETAPLDRFTHTFMESGEPDPALAAQAEVIFADLTGLDAAGTVQALAESGAELIVLAGREQIADITGLFPALTDLWPLPMGREELVFRFQKWQQAFQQEKDLWESRQYLEAAINSVPNLVWYKTKDGVHEKVNDSFCETVNKTKEQVQGQRHAYIWDVEQDDPSCIESERIVMETRKTGIAEETVQTGEGTRLMTTYKSPLYDVDGSVMGTVGVGIDMRRSCGGRTGRWRPCLPLWTAAYCATVWTGPAFSALIGPLWKFLAITPRKSCSKMVLTPSLLPSWRKTKRNCAPVSNL